MKPKIAKPALTRITPTFEIVKVRVESSSLCTSFITSPGTFVPFNAAVCASLMSSLSFVFSASCMCGFCAARLSIESKAGLIRFRAATC
eukprot:CAMPEP_0115711986 /NCGR_PEP_ID=MMETSP0272-20121206/73875_1 /TAXON_ID=71861 /ORGANISM="Scrippsiella trochoidea, Strain CCMP3099" /LENGTH=88 /DNA_ID=CAMNT_0003153855 /DNA_START=594 /DNA_END=857 /DNA_ORIENTATION=-